MRQFVLAAVVVGALAAPALADVIVVPRDFGTIQAAVDAAFAGDKIIIKRGTYNESVTINAKSDLYIRGRGLVTVNGGALPGIVVTGSANVRVLGLSLISTGSHGITFIGSPNGLVTKCRTQATNGLVALSSDGTRFVRCASSATNFGIWFLGTGTHIAERCVITANPATRAVYAQGETARLIRCKITYNGVPTISPVLTESSVRFFAERCRIQAAPVGGVVWGFELKPSNLAATHELNRNRIEGCTIGIAGTNVNNVTAFGNIVNAASVYGIALIGVNYDLERNKILLGAGTVAGILVANSANTTITGNKIQGAGTGVLIPFGTGVKVSGNKLKNLTNGVSLTGDANTVGPKNKYRNVITPIDDGGTNTTILDTP